MQEVTYTFDRKIKKIHSLLIELSNGIGIFTLNMGNCRYINTGILLTL